MHFICLITVLQYIYKWFFNACICHFSSGTLAFNDVLNAGNSESDELLGTTEKLVKFDDPVNIQFTSVSMSCMCFLVL